MAIAARQRLGFRESLVGAQIDDFLHLGELRRHRRAKLRDPLLLGGVVREPGEGVDLVRELAFGGVEGVQVDLRAIRADRRKRLPHEGHALTDGPVS
ncbi:MAG TPA: hypothetical protein VFP72_19315 [Kineosporiaceae bacterium]|nr:hypothetical protein [Kineosporiaceae bacterium]